MSLAENRLGVTWSSPPRSTIDGTVIGGRVASRRSIASKRGSLGALPWRTRYEWITTVTKSGLSNDGAVRSNVASSNFQLGDHSCHSSWHISRRLRSSPARPRSVLKYHWYQYLRSCAGGAGRGGASAFWTL